VNEHAFFGHAIGGSLGAEKQQMYDVVAHTAPLLAEERPIHLLGIGGFRDIFEGVVQGIDTFDCVHPTRLARHGGALVPVTLREGRSQDHLNLKNAVYQEDDRPLDPDCGCPACQTVSRAYLHYLFKAKELLALQLITLHNVFTMNRVFQDVRQAIATGTLAQAQKVWVADA
jgi:queuine tRNA-ribosyltransferase